MLSGEITMETLSVVNLPVGPGLGAGTGDQQDEGDQCLGFGQVRVKSFVFKTLLYP